MLLKIVYLLVRRLLSLVVLVFRGDRASDVFPATPATLFVWHRKRAAKKYDTNRRRAPGRPAGPVPKISSAQVGAAIRVRRDSRRHPRQENRPRGADQGNRKYRTIADLNRRRACKSKSPSSSGHASAKG